jgi:TonB family protein
LATAVVTMSRRSRPVPGPALRGFSLPLGWLTVSVVAHLAAAVGLWVGAEAWRSHQPKTYVVNLVPAVAAVGSPHGRATTTPAPRATVPAPPAPRSAPAELPRPEPVRQPPKAVREPARELPKALPEPARELPKATEMPDRPPDRLMPPRPPAIPRPGDKELPRPPERELPPAVAAVTRPAPPPPPPPPPPAPLGRPTGSPQGVGRVSLAVGDFPFAWYLRVIERKIQDSWRQPAGSHEGQEAVAIFEITPDGRVRRVAIEKTSGDPLYDQAALRAIMEANPFPPLPTEFKEPPLRVHLGFAVRNRG